ncbi:D-beta-hydroxybutyrate dehydrogenase, mitochondrial-like isoform X2 [Dreissena polymorpha]|uniref:D-beta-hydroxybutyrate dehydrogenase, mitochondrial n=1 Tax=Dreissena polymorpha TaxID=45954 RepID=A0A9D4M5N0_DREPO|nr:D-beta-hydroxybutyrate dehydrogenase, mitochondrial-like isoform X2 [Dreissena polymorpha]KAH3869724.1 hypothetical protein DPMN_032893 [Dreissena polymorpha]
MQISQENKETYIFYSFLLVSGFILYWLIREAYLYGAILVVFYVTYQKIVRNGIRFVEGKGRGVLITGCDTGFGHYLALRLWQNGFTVFAGCYLPDDEGAKSLQRKDSETLQVLKLDVTKDNHVEKALKHVQENLPQNGLWAVVNNAAINYLCDIEFCSLDLMRRVEDVNYYGMVRITKAFIPLLRKSKGRIINVTSVKGRIALPADVCYTTTKWAGEAFSDILRREMKRFGIKVVIVEPGNFGGITGMLNDKNIERVVTALEESWQNASDEIKAAYGRKYIDDEIEGLKSASRTSAKFIEPVINAMHDAVANERPEYRYLVNGGTKPAVDWYCVSKRFEL